MVSRSNLEHECYECLIGSLTREPLTGCLLSRKSWNHVVEQIHGKKQPGRLFHSILLAAHISLR